MANNEAGAFLNITPDVLNKLDSFDKKLEQIQKHSGTAANVLKNGFSSIVVDTSKLESAITSLANKIDALKGNPFEGAGKGAEDTTRKTTSLNESLSRAAQLLNQIGGSKVSQNTFSAWNIAGLKEGISDLKRFVENTKTLSKAQQQVAVESMRYMKMELDYQRQTDEQRAQSAEKAADRKAAADRRAAKEAEALAKQQELAQRTTPQGALDYSKSTKSLQQNVQAIEYLKKARLSLNTTDANYKHTLEQINQAIAKHDLALQQAGVRSQNLAARHRNLMDTAGQLSRQLALLFSVSQIEGYISKLANVRGEFELQQRSLQAILQNKTQADKIFNQTVELAVKSPFQIKQLVSYTKQLAAYRIESDKLYDTTKRLADVSAGLGVDMGRLILAYGQVKAAAYLRGTEVRQFTEAGINLYGELQRYFQEVKGEAYTTAQIVDMISKRKVTFEDIENIFTRLTDKGGLFYNMQEIQAETLQGKMSNLKDSIDVMMNAIGKANEDTLKGTIDTVKVLIDNWETLVNVAKVFAPIISSMALTAWAKRIGAANGVIGLFSVGLGKAGNAIKAFGATFKASLPLMAITAVIGAMNELISVNEEYRKSVSESNANYLKNRVIVAEIDKESESDIKSALTKLVKAMNNEGFEIEIKANLSESEAKIEFDKYKKTYEDFLYDMLLLEQKYAANKKRGWANPFADKAFTDDIDTNATEYKTSLSEFIAKGEQVRAVLLKVSEESEILTKKQIEQFKQLSAGPNKGENIINYYERLAKALEEVGYKADEAYGGRISKQNILGGEHQTMGIWGVGKELDRQMAGFSTSFITMNRDLEIFKKDAISIIGDVREDMSDEEKNRLKVRIDKLALTAGWDEFVRDVVYQVYKINLEVDDDEVEKEMEGLDVIFKKWFSTHKYKLGINYDDLGEKDIFKGFLAQGDEMAAAYKKAELSAERLKNAANTMFNQNQSGLTKEQFKNAFGTVETVSKDQLIKYYEELAKANKQAAIDAGWREKQKGSGAERDIWSERISVLKEMQSRYEKLNDLMGETRAIEETRSAFKGALDFTKMGEVIKAEDIIPTKQGMIDALEKLLEKIPNDVKNAAKRTGLEKEIAELKIGIQQEYLKEQLEKTKKNIEDMFNGLDLHQKLKDAGLSEAEVQALFPGLAKTLDEVQKGIEIEFQTKYADTYKDPNTQQYKEYQDAIKKLDQQRVKESQDLAQRLVKDYKTQLSEQLQLDMWYYKEKANIAKSKSEAIARIEADASLSEAEKERRKKTVSELANQEQKNLTSQYSKKSDENAWKQFQESDFYIDLFQNLDNVSTKTLVAMRDKLEQMKEQLKDLQPSQVRAIVNNMEKLNEVLAGRNPFEELIPNLKSYIGSLKDRKKHEDDYLKALEKQEEVEKRLYGYTKTNEDGSKERVEGESEVLAKLEAEYNALVENGNATQKQLDAAEKKLNAAKDAVKKSEEELANNKKITDQKKEQVDADKKKLEAANKSLNEVAKYGKEAVNAVSEFTGMLEGFGVEIPEWLKGTTEGLGQIFDGLGSIDLTKPFSIVTGGIKTLAGVGKMIGSIFGIGNKDKRKEREIQRQIKNVENLQKAYDVLKEKMDNAWSAVSFSDMNKQTLQNVDAQIASYQQMIASEKGKKDIDWGRIEEWQDTIEELKKTKKELEQQAIEEMGGIGETNYKDAAQAFADAWVDAFNESEDGLKALQETFDDYITNLIKKQAMMRLVQARMKSVFEAIDKSVTEGSDGGINLTKQELANIQKIGESALEGLNEDLLNLMETLGYTGTSAGDKAELSALTQSIQGITEQTAEELAALLNSVRYFVAQQTTDISAIRALLDARYAFETGGTDANPMLIELRAQTGYLERITDYIGRVFAPSANSKGAGLRVYMQ